MKLKTTTQCVDAAKGLLKDAESITNKRDHIVWWDRKVDLYWIIQDALETGGFVGEAYDELREAKHLIDRAERIAGRYAND